MDKCVEVGGGLRESWYLFLTLALFGDDSQSHTSAVSPSKKELACSMDKRWDGLQRQYECSEEEKSLFLFEIEP